MFVYSFKHVNTVNDPYRTVNVFIFCFSIDMNYVKLIVFTNFIQLTCLTSSNTIIGLDSRDISMLRILLIELI